MAFLRRSWQRFNSILPLSAERHWYCKRDRLLLRAGTGGHLGGGSYGKGINTTLVLPSPNPSILSRWCNTASFEDSLNSTKRPRLESHKGEHKLLGLDADTIDGVLDILSHDKNTVHCQNESTLLQYFVTLLRVSGGGKKGLTRLAENQRAQEFHDKLIHCLPNFPMKKVSLCLFLCSKYGFLEKRLISALIKECRRRPLPGEFTDTILRSLMNLGLYTTARDLFNSTAYRIAGSLEKGHATTSLGNLANTIHDLVIADHWIEELSPALMKFLETNLDTWEDMYSLTIFVWALVRQRADFQNHPDLLPRVGQVVAKRIAKGVSPLDLNMLSWAFGVQGVYESHYFHALAEKLVSTRDPQFLEPRMLSTWAWSTSRVRFYHPELLDRISGLALKILDSFNAHDLGNLAYAFGRLNHPDRRLLQAIVGRFEREPRLMASSEQACYNIAWACMVMDFYPTTLLQHVLSPKKVKGLLSTSATASAYDLMQLYTAVTVEHPQLGTELNTQDSIIKTVLPALFKYLNSNKHKQAISVWDMNMQKALVSLLGECDSFTAQPVTTSGYVFDAEVLLSAANQVVSPPKAWMKQSYQDVLRMFDGRSDSIHSDNAVHTDSCRDPSYSQKQISVDLGTLLSTTRAIDGHCSNDSGDLLAREAGKQGQTSRSQTLSSDSLLRNESDTPQETYFNLASDWQNILQNFPGESVKRRLAIEADGPWHFAANCEHPLGHMVLKHRQLEALGWEVISVPYYEWEHLTTVEAQTQYLARRIFRD